MENKKGRAEGLLQNDYMAIELELSEVGYRYQEGSLGLFFPNKDTKDAMFLTLEAKDNGWFILSDLRGGHKRFKSIERMIGFIKENEN